MKPIKIYNDTDLSYTDIGNCCDLIRIDCFDRSPIGKEQYFEFENKIETIRVCFVNMKRIIKCYVKRYDKRN